MKPQERTRAVLESKAPPTWKLILVDLADHMNEDDGNCWPGVDRISTETGVCERSVREALREMEKVGILTQTYRGPVQPPQRHIQWEPLAMFAGVAKTARGGNHCQGRVAKIARGGGKDCLPGAAKTAPKPTIEPTSKPTTEPTSESTGVEPPQEQSHGPHEHPQGGDQLAGVPAPGGAGSTPEVERAPTSVGDEQGVGGEATPTDRAWTAITSSVGVKWALTPTWKKWLEQGAKVMGGWSTWDEIAEWVAHGRHRDAQYLRDRKDPVTLIRASNCGRYLAMARQEKPDGANTAPERVNGVSPGAAWEQMFNTLQTNRWRAPERWSPNPDVNRAIQAALDRAGGVYRLRTATAYDTKEIRVAFEGAFREVYHG